MITLQNKITQKDGSIKHDERTCELPLLPIRFAINSAFVDDAPEMAKVAALVAAFAVCWPDGPWPSLRSCGYDMVEFGIAANDAARRAGWDIATMISEGGRARSAMLDDTIEVLHLKVEEESDFSEAPADSGTT